MSWQRFLEQYSQIHWIWPTIPNKRKYIHKESTGVYNVHFPIEIYMILRWYWCHTLRDTQALILKNGQE